MLILNVKYDYSISQYNTIFTTHNYTHTQVWNHVEIEV